MAEKVESEVSTARLETLTDGIFAIAMTLLVLDLKVPHQIEDLPKLLPNLIVFLISFLVLGNYWVANHTEFRFIKRSDHGLIWLSIFFNLFICLVPFSASLLGEHNGEKTAVFIYGINLLCVTITHYLVWMHAIKNKLVVELDPKLVSSGNLLSYLALIPYILAIIFGFVDTRISILIYALTPLPYIFGIYYRLFGI